MERGEASAPFPGRFYCRSCMLASPPCYEGYAQEGDSVCPGCGGLIAETGHSHWLSIEQLPAEMRLEWERNNAPALLRVLRLRWPRAITTFGSDGPPRLLA